MLCQTLAVPWARINPTHTPRTPRTHTHTYTASCPDLLQFYLKTEGSSATGDASWSRRMKGKCLSTTGWDNPLFLTQCGDTSTHQDFKLDSQTGMFQIMAPAPVKLYEACMQGSSALGKIDVYRCSTSNKNELWTVNATAGTFCNANNICLAQRDKTSPPWGRALSQPAVSLSAGEGDDAKVQCYRRANIQITRCDHDRAYDTYSYGALPPAPAPVMPAPKPYNPPSPAPGPPTNPPVTVQVNGLTLTLP